LLSFDACSFPGRANVLAREPTADDIDNPAPRLSVEGSDIIPDGELWQDSVSLPLEQDFSTVRFNLDSTHTSMSEKDAAEDSSPCSCKKV
jgi:hypothetical protein